jgi:hypothetical protein
MQRLQRRDPARRDSNAPVVISMLWNNMDDQTIALMPIEHFSAKLDAGSSQKMRHAVRD